MTVRGGDRIRDPLAPLGRSRAFSWRVAAVFLPAATTAQSLIDADGARGPLDDWLGATVAGIIAFCVVFAVVNRLARSRSPRPVHVLAASPSRARLGA